MGISNKVLAASVDLGIALEMVWDGEQGGGMLWSWMVRMFVEARGGEEGRSGYLR